VLELDDVLTEADVGAGCERMGCSTVDGDRRLEARQLFARLDGRRGSQEKVD